ncbi:unnamed protein product, partial [Adineta steineri]
DVSEKQCRDVFQSVSPYHPFYSLYQNIPSLHDIVFHAVLEWKLEAVWSHHPPSSVYGFLL